MYRFCSSSIFRIKTRSCLSIFFKSKFSSNSEGPMSSEQLPESESSRSEEEEEEED